MSTLARDIVTLGTQGHEHYENLKNFPKKPTEKEPLTDALASSLVNHVSTATRVRRHVTRTLYTGTPSSEDDEYLSDVEADVSRLSPASRRRMKRWEEKNKRNHY